MKSVIYEFDPVIYPFKLLVSKNFDVEELGGMYYCIDDDENLIDSPEAFTPNRRTIARTIQCAPKDGSETFYLVLLYRPEVIGTGTLAHESLHIANFVGEWLGFLPKKANEDEPQAYLVQWISNCIDMVMKGKPEEMKGILVNGNDADTTESVQ